MTTPTLDGYLPCIRLLFADDHAKDVDFPDPFDPPGRPSRRGRPPIDASRTESVARAAWRPSRGRITRTALGGPVARRGHLRWAARPRARELPRRDAMVTRLSGSDRRQRKWPRRATGPPQRRTRDSPRLGLQAARATDSVFSTRRWASTAARRSAWWVRTDREKSTIFRMIVGEEQPDTGQVAVERGVVIAISARTSAR